MKELLLEKWIRDMASSLKRGETKYQAIGIAMARIIIMIRILLFIPYEIGHGLILSLPLPPPLNFY